MRAAGGARLAVACASAAFTLLSPLSAHAQTIKAEILPQVEVVGTTPLAGSDQPLREVAGNVRIYSARQLGGDAGVAGFLGERAAGFSSEDAQGNRWSPELCYRGDSAPCRC